MVSSTQFYIQVLGSALFLLVVSTAVQSAAAQFDPVGAGLDGVAAGATAWADVDGDGDLDLLLVGNASGTQDDAEPSATLYENQGDGTFVPMEAGLDGVSVGAAAFGDFDDDGDPDLIITGNTGGFSAENLPENSAQVYENDGSGNFTKVNAGIEGVTAGSVDWGDVNGDGTLDLVVTGNVGGFGELNPICPPVCNPPDPEVRIYEGDGTGSFSLLDAGIEEGVEGGSSRFGDVDGDGALDLVVTGGQGSLDDPQPFTAVYENDGTGTFEPLDSGLTDVAGGSSEWVDVDGDGALDLVLTGATAEEEPTTELYLNDGDGNLSLASTDLADVVAGAAVPRDVDADGDPDLVVTGRNSAEEPTSIVYENDGSGAFTALQAGLEGLEGSAAAWGDADGDADPDLALAGRDADSTATARIYENQIGGIAEAQFIHNAADPEVETIDLYVNGELQAENFEFRSATSFVDVPAGAEMAIGAAPAGSEGPEDIFAERSVTLTLDSTYTVTASGVRTPDDFVDNPDGKDIGFDFFIEPGAQQDAASDDVDVRATHGGTDAPTIDLKENGTALFQDLTYGTVTPEYRSVTTEEDRLVVASSDSDEPIAAFRTDPLSESNGQAAVLLASGFLDPEENQDGPGFSLAVAQSNGEVAVLPENQAPVVAIPPPDDTLEASGPSVQLTVLDQTVFNDPEGDELTISATSSDSAVVDILEASPGTVRLEPKASGIGQTAAITLTASDGVAEGETTFDVRVEEQADEEPTARATAFVGEEVDGDTLSFGETGLDGRFVGVNGAGAVEAERFDGPPEDTSGIGLENVSQYRMVVAGPPGVTFGDETEIRFPVANFGGIGDPTQVVVYRRSTPGEGTFKAVPTTVDDGGTPDDPSDDVLVATTGTLSEFVLASDSEPLPVELTEFAAHRDGQAAVLEWRTAHETNNAGFRIQHRAPERGTWTDVGFKESKAPDGTTDEPRSYAHRVDDLSRGTHGFRLEHVDLNGTRTRTDTVTVEVQAEHELTLDRSGPNPVRDGTRVVFTTRRDGAAHVALYNILGQKVRELRTEDARAGRRYAVEVSVRALASGAYFVRLDAPSGTRTKRIQVVR